MKLTPKQKAFVDEYLIDLNATQAAIRAGYSEKTARAVGAENLTKPNIQTAIQERIQEREKRTEVTQDMVVQQLAKVAFSDLKEYVEWGPNGIVIRPSDNVDGTVLQSISETMLPKGGKKTEIKLTDKMKALELLGKHLGMFSDKMKVDLDVSLADVLTQAWNELSNDDGTHSE